MDLEKYLFIMDITNLDDLHMFYIEQTEDIKNILYSIVHESSDIATRLQHIHLPEYKKPVHQSVKNIESLIFNYNTVCGQAKRIKERIEQLKKAIILPVSI